MEGLQFHRYRHQDSLLRRVRELKDRLQGVQPAELAARIGAFCLELPGERAELRMDVFGEAIIVTLPELAVLDGRTGELAPLNTQALLLYHFCATDGSPVAGRWISFRELPDGGFYHQAFQGYTGHEIAKLFGNDLVAFERAARLLAGRRVDGVGDAAFAFQALPRVPLVAAYWLGDEDFPPSARILFDESAGHHLPTDACAMLGSTLTRRLIAAGAQCK